MDFIDENYLRKILEAERRIEGEYDGLKGMVLEIKNEKPRTDFENDMEEPVRLYRNQKYAYAIDKFWPLTEKYPENGTLYYYLALCFQYLVGGLEYSAKFFEIALEYLDNVETWVDYGNVLKVNGNIKKAIEVLENARVRFPDDGTAAMILSHIYDKTNDKKQLSIVIAEANSRGFLEYDERIREWNSDNQILKPILSEWI